MALIYETNNFILESFETPHVSREEGGNIRILPKRKMKSRGEMTIEEAKDFIRLTMIVDEAYPLAMKEVGIDIIRLNYQDMGNWAYKKNQEPNFHMHIYGRVTTAKKQIFPEAVYLPARESGFYVGFEPLNVEDVKEIQRQIEIISKQEKYQVEKW